MPQDAKLFSEFHIVIDFAIESDPVPAVRRAHGLMPGFRQIENRQSAMDEERLGDEILLNITALTDLTPLQREPTGIIRPPVLKLLHKRLHPFGLNWAWRHKNKTADTAHLTSPCLSNKIGGDLISGATCAR